MDNHKSANEKAIEAFEESLDNLKRKKIEYESKRLELRAKFEKELLLLKERYDFDRLNAQIEKEEQLLQILHGDIIIPSAHKSNYLGNSFRKNMPKTYANAKNFKSKVAYVMNEIQSGTVDQVMERLLKYEPNINKKSLTQLSQNLSDMRRKKELFSIDKVGKKFVYSIFPEKDVV